MNQSGGDSDKLYTILQLEKILYLPKSNLFYNDNTDKYLDSIDSYTLMYLIEKLGLSNVDALNNIFKPSMSGGDDDPELNPDVIPQEGDVDPSQPPQEGDVDPSQPPQEGDVDPSQSPLDKVEPSQPQEDVDPSQPPLDKVEPSQPQEDVEPSQPQDDVDPSQLPQEGDVDPSQPPQDDDVEPTQPQEDVELTQPQEDDVESSLPQEDDVEPTQPQEDDVEPSLPQEDVGASQSQDDYVEPSQPQEQDESLNNTKYETQIDTQTKVSPDDLLDIPIAPKDTNYEKQYGDLQKAVSEAQKKIQMIQKEIAEKDIKLKNFQCIKDDPVGEYFGLFDYILDCNNICLKDVNWYNVIINQEKLDSEYELSIEQDNTNYLGIDMDEMDSILAEFIDDDELEEIFRNRLVECAYMEPKVTYPPYPPPPVKPDPNIRELVEQYNKEIENYNPKKPEPIIEEDECHKCLNDCILYLNPSYKGFLYKKHDRVNTVEKLRMLVYCELRLNKLMKYLKLEADRLFIQNYDVVKDLLFKIKEKSSEFVDIKTKKSLEIEKNTADIANLNSKLDDKKKELSELMTEISKRDNNADLSGGAEENITGDELTNSDDDSLELTDDDMSSSDNSIRNDPVDDDDNLDDNLGDNLNDNLDDDDDNLDDNLGDNLNDNLDDDGLSDDVSSDDGLSDDVSSDDGLSDDVPSDDSSDSDMLSDISSDEFSDEPSDEFSDEPSDESVTDESVTDESVTDDSDTTEEELSDDDVDSIENDIDVIPSCKTIAKDIKTGIIKKDNFVYLTNKCLEEVDKALRS